MRAVLFIFVFVVFVRNIGACQIPSYQHNATTSDSTKSPLIDSFVKKYDFVLAYTEAVSPIRNYKIIAQKYGRWSQWTYSDNLIRLTRKGNVVKVDTIRVGIFRKVSGVITERRANELLAFLKEKHFWTLSNDSLNQYGGTLRKYYDEESKDTVFIRDKGLTDGTSYRFEAHTLECFRVTQSYAPDYFARKYPYMIDRKRFVLCRDKFLKWWTLGTY